MVKKTVKKVVLLGESAVGKTSLIRRFVHDEFSDDYISTIGTKVSKKVLNIDFEGQETQVNLMIWDMLGREGYMSTQARQIVGAQGVIVVGDITRPETMQNIERYWIPMVLRTIGTVKLPFVFLANKVDLADGDKVMAVLPGGVTARVFNPHNADQVAAYMSGAPVYWWFSDQAIAEHAVSELVLRPAGK